MAVGDPERPVGHEVDEDPREVEEYWTEERSRAAQPAPMPTLELDADEAEFDE